MNDPKDKNIFKPLSGKTFRFDCHKTIPCFTECCAKLHLILTPYDILRMKNSLGLSSAIFLDRYTETVLEDRRFPMVKLKMSEDEKKRCPFVDKDGCHIYDDRPAACRLYPLAKASSTVEGERDAREKFFVVREAHCLGFMEEKQWSLDEWLGHEGVKDYSFMNREWLEIITSRKSLGVSGKDATRKFQMFFMASYNLDEFRTFVFQSKFFELFEVPQDLHDALAQSDVSLLKFAFSWLKFSLFGEKTMERKRLATLSS